MMNKPTTEKIKEILEGAPEWASQWDGLTKNYYDVYDEFNLAHLREILTLRQRVEELESQQSEVAARAVEVFADKVIRKHTRTVGQAGASGPFGVVEVDYIKTERDNYANQLRKGESDE